MIDQNRLSQFGQKFLDECGILQLMDDLGKGVGKPGVMMLGGGNPSHIPAVQAYFRDSMGRILDSEDRFEGLIGNYDEPQGHRPFLEALATLLRETYQWELSADNIALTTGSQTAFFYLFNLFSGRMSNGPDKKILLPMAPEYIGYVDATIQSHAFRSFAPHITFVEEGFFKYRVDFEALRVGDDIGAICVSRPTNPTGNVLTEDEIEQLSQLAQQHSIPLIIDNAYGMPFPGIIFSDVRPIWEPHIILCLSLSKLGLPGARTGIVIADPTIIRAISGMNAVLSLAPSSIGAQLALEMVQSADILRLSRDVIRPHYQSRAHQAVLWLRQALDGVEFYIHKPEGALFLWIWFKDLPISSTELYRRLAERNVFVIDGRHFYPGLDGEWRHKQECIRLNYAQEPSIVQAGIAIIAQEVRRAWQM